MDKFSGQMYLCDFGAVKDGCPEGPGCVGPGGTRITPSRLYSYRQWSIQRYVKQSLLSILPEHEKEIEDSIDTGEYGVESYSARFVCTFLFVLGSTHDLYQVVNMMRILRHVPSVNEPWIRVSGDEITISVRGMSMPWKILNFILVVLPKLALWLFTSTAGMMFLMETAAIQDVIVNCTALTFILGIDEVLFETITALQTRIVMDKLEGYPIGAIQHQGDAEADDDTLMHKSGIRTWLNWESIPSRLLLVGSIWLALTINYYHGRCTRGPDGALVSVPMHLPKSTHLSALSVFFPWFFPIPAESDPYWKMPEEVGN